MDSQLKPSLTFFKFVLALRLLRKMRRIVEHVSGGVSQKNRGGEKEANASPV